MTREAFAALCRDFTIVERAVSDLREKHGDSDQLNVISRFLHDLPTKLLELRAEDVELQEAKAAAKEAEGLADQIDGLLDDMGRLQARNTALVRAIHVHHVSCATCTAGDDFPSEPCAGCVESDCWKFNEAKYTPENGGGPDA